MHRPLSYRLNQQPVHRYILHGNWYGSDCILLRSYLTLAQFTVKVCLLTALPFGVVTATLPVFASAGTIA